MPTAIDNTQQNTQQNNGVSIMDLLGQLVQGVGQGGSNFSKPITNQGQNAVQTLTQPIPGTSNNNSTQSNTGANVGPYQQGVLQGLKKAGEEHAYNAASMGADPNQIMQHPVMGMASPVAQNNQTQATTPTAKTGESPYEILHNLLFGNTASNAGNPANPTIRRESGGALGLLNPGSDTEQPGNVYKLLTLLAGGGAYRPSTETGVNATTKQALEGKTPMQKGEKEKMLATAAFDTTKLTNESITASATAFDKIYTTLSGPEKAGLWFGKVPQRLQSISSQLQAAASQQSASFGVREKGAQRLMDNKTSSGAGGEFKILKVHKE